MSVKRYDFDCYAFYDSARLTVQECDDGDYVLHSDYTALLASHNALREAVKKYLHAHDIYGMRVAYTFGTSDEANIISAARAEVDRLIGEGPDAQARMDLGRKKPQD